MVKCASAYSCCKLHFLHIYDNEIIVWWKVLFNLTLETGRVFDSSRKQYVTLEGESSNLRNDNTV